MTHQQSEQDLISHWLDLTGESFGLYAWAGPGTWAVIAQGLIDKEDLIYERGKGSIGDYIWIKPEPFDVRILMNPFSKEGFIYPAHHGTPIFKFVSL